MLIKDVLTEDMKHAMKNKEKLRLAVIRMVRSSIRNIEIDDKKELTDDDVLTVLMKEVKMRKDSIEEFKKADRADLIEQTEQEIEVLQKYLPEPLTDEDLCKMVEQVIANLGATTVKDMGKVMEAVKSEAKGRADGKRISQMVRKSLK